MLTAILVIMILVFLIVVHEVGHFIAAKIFGVRVDEFGIGYPPRAYRIGRWGGTEYTLNWIPFGGFVRLFGEDEGGEHGRGSLVDSARWKQALILIAGVSMNAVAAWVLFSGAYMTGILHPVEEPVAGSWLVVSDVVAGSPASAAGIHRGDEILGVEDSDLQSLTTLSPEAVTEFVGSRPGEELVLRYKRNGEMTEVGLRPAHGVVEEDAGRAAIGIGLVLVTAEALSLKAAIVEGWYQTLGTFAVVGSGIWALFKDALTGAPNLKDVVGPVGLVGIVGEAAQSGWGYVLSLAAFISVNLAIINMIPIPALDGGRLVVVGVESVLRRRAPKLALQSLNTLGVALIILLMVTVTYNDIARLIA
ncbi:MAG TPA: site-2 protease family protein [Candidatus Paceibacterota bacterium]